MLRLQKTELKRVSFRTVVAQTHMAGNEKRLVDAVVHGQAFVQSRANYMDQMETDAAAVAPS